MMSWPCRLSSAARALSRRQLPQYILAAPAVNARIFIRSFGNRTNCSKTRHVGLNLTILERMVGKVSDDLVFGGDLAMWGSLVSCGRLSIGPLPRSCATGGGNQPPRRLSTCPTLMCLAALLLPLAASGQSVRGTVTDS